MRVLKGLKALARPPRRAVVTVGMFDGVHLAHQRLIRTTVRLARRLRGTSVVITFDPDPQAVLDPQPPPQPLMSMTERLQHIASLGADVVWIIPFTRRFSKLSPEAFVHRVLIQRLRATCVVVGETFAFGKDRVGTLPTLRALGQRHGMRVVVLSPMHRQGVIISSSRIRACLRSGSLGLARKLLGKPVTLSGIVVSGDGRASRLGFPTANVQLSSGLMPARGVYQVVLHAEGRPWPGLMNVGVRPTFGSGPLVCEVHLPRFHGTLYGALVTIALIRRLRNERRFATPRALIAQIRRDLAKAHLPSS